MYHERGKKKKKKRWTEEEVGRQHQRVDRVEVRQLPEGCGEEEKMERAGCKAVRGGAPSDPWGLRESKQAKKKTRRTRHLVEKD